MSLPGNPPEASLTTSENMIGEWDFPLEMKQSPVARILTRFLLTSERLIVLQLPTARIASGLAGRFSLRRAPSSFMDDMGKWHVMLDAKLIDLPEPILGRVEFGHATALPSNRALILGPTNFPVGEDPAAEAMLSRIRGQWAAVKATLSQPLG
jgi:hypothetical protein